MSIYLGNVSIEEMQSRSGVVFPEELIAYMSDKRQHEACNLQKDKWHCFDIPFVLACENIEMAKEIYRHLESMSDYFKEQLQISVQE